MGSTSKCVDGAWTANLECQAKGAGCSGKPTNIAHATITCKDEDKMVDDATKYYDGTLCNSWYFFKNCRGQPTAGGRWPRGCGRRPIGVGRRPTCDGRRATIGGK